MPHELWCRIFFISFFGQTLRIYLISETIKKNFSNQCKAVAPKPTYFSSNFLTAYNLSSLSKSIHTYNTLYIHSGCVHLPTNMCRPLFFLVYNACPYRVKAFQRNLMSYFDKNKWSGCIKCLSVYRMTGIIQNTILWFDFQRRREHL